MPGGVGAVPAVRNRLGSPVPVAVVASAGAGWAMSAVTALDVFRDVRGRAYAAGWLFDPDSPLAVQLALSAGEGATQVWCFARDWLEPGGVGPAGGDIALIGAGERLVVALYPLTSRSKTLTGSLTVALDFLAATEALIPRCSGCASPDCVSCVTTRAGLDAALAGLARQEAP